VARVRLRKPGDDSEALAVVSCAIESEPSWGPDLGWLRWSGGAGVSAVGRLPSDLSYRAMVGAHLGSGGSLSMAGTCRWPRSGGNSSVPLAEDR
jgi:hypothetical protein